MIIDMTVKTNSLKAWMLAARPKTLSGAAVPVMLGSACAFHEIGMDIFRGEGWIAMILCFLFAFLMQIDANFVNDYFDCVRGRDNEERLGPLRACQQGWVTLKAMRIAIVVTSILSCLVGLPLVYFGGVKLIGIGAACLLFCFLYTTCLAGIGLGDLLVLVFFGVVPVCFTYYVIVPETLQDMSVLPWVLSLSCGLVIDTLLIVNNYRDIDNDAHSGKKTLVVLIGKKNTEVLYMVLVSLALVLVLLQYGFSNINLLLTFLVYFIYISTWNKMKAISKGRELNSVLAETARNIFIYGLAVSILLLI